MHGLGNVHTIFSSYVFVTHSFFQILRVLAFFTKYFTMFCWLYLGFPATNMFKCEQQTKIKQMTVCSKVRIHNINKIERSDVRTFKSRCMCHKLRILLEGQRINISDMNLWIEEELPLILLKEYELNSHTKGYHTDMMNFSRLD